MHRACLIFCLAALGCGGRNQPQPAPPPPAPAVASPEALCARAAKLMKLSEHDRTRCEEKMAAAQKADPVFYKCLDKCTESATSEDAIGPCMKPCLPPEHKVAQHDTDAEAARNLGSIEVGSKNQFQQETDTSNEGLGPFVHRFCPSSKHPVPAELPPAGEKVSVAASEWNDPAWTCLKFSINEPQYFQYSYEWNGVDGVESGYVAIARRRLPNGKVRTYRLSGRGSETGDAQRVSFTEKDE